MTRYLAIFAALAFGTIAGSNVCSFALPQPSSAYESRFGFSPADDDGFDEAMNKLRRELIRVSKSRGGKWYSVEVKLTPEG